MLFVAIIQITCFSSFYHLIPTSISKLTIFKFTSLLTFFGIGTLLNLGCRDDTFWGVHPHV